MRYNINASLIYDAADGTLTLPGSNSPDSQLSITASALLLFFLQHPEVVSREDVLKKVWDDNGLTSSNSNLNQYLSMLRKTFRHYDIENIILTISLGNLQFNPDIVVETLDSLSLQPAPEVYSEQTKPAEVVKTRNTFTANRKINWNMASAVLLLLSLLMLPLSLINHLNPVFISPVPVAGQDCELSGTTDMVDSVTPHDYEKKFIDVLQKLNLTCNPEQRYIFFYSDKLQTKGLGRVFLAHCAIHGNIPYGYCDNYFYYSWEPK